MKLQEAMDKRHSIREFEPKKVPRKLIEKLIVNATKAPSAANRQPWRFYVIDSEKQIKQISKLNGSLLINQKQQFDKLEAKLQVIANSFYVTLGHCKTVIIIYMEKEENKILRENGIKSISAAIENLMLSAVENKLGTCWMGSFMQIEKGINNITKVKNKELVAGILIGYPKKRYKPLIREKKKLNETLKFI